MSSYVPCAVPGCEDRKSSRQRFPNPEKDKDRFQRWITAVANSKLVNLESKQIYNNYRVCHQHFTEKDTSTNMYLKRIAVPSQKLSIISVPSAKDEVYLEKPTSPNSESQLPETSVQPEEVAVTHSETAQKVPEEGSAALPRTPPPSSLVVIATVCDQGSTNRSAIESMIADSRAQYLKNDKTPKRRIIVDESEVIPLYDVPHLVKGLRNNLLEKDLIWQKQDTVYVAKWEDIVNAYYIDSSENIRCIPKITECHVIKGKLKKMKVSCATQVFSHSMAAAIPIMARNDVSENEDTPVYQYYTIVTDPLNECIEQDKSIIYLTFGQNENNEYEAEPEATELQANETSCEPDQQNLSNVKMVTFGDVQILMTNTDGVDNDMSVLKPDILSSETGEHDSHIEDDLLLNANEETEEQLEEEPDADYQQIKLEDGTCAIIDKKLLNSIIGNANVQSNTSKHKKYRCMYLGCGKVYSTPQHLTVHVRNHTGVRPYNCTVEGCDKAFATGYSLKAHLRTHTGEKPYACSVCTKQFKTSGDLQKHMRTHTGEKPFKCPIEGCGRSFTTSNIRKVHIRSHTGERPYVCEEPNCGKAFASATNYKNHMRIHSGEKPYVCTFAGCDKRFTEYSSLYKHNMVHKPCKPFKCNYCGQLCKQESTLKAHKRTIHSIVITDDGTEILVKREDEYSEVILEISDQPNSVFLNDDDD